MAAAAPVHGGALNPCTPCASAAPPGAHDSRSQPYLAVDAVYVVDGVNARPPRVHEALELLDDLSQRTTPKGWPSQSVSYTHSICTCLGITHRAHTHPHPHTCIHAHALEDAIML